MRQTALNMVYEMAKRDPRVVFIGSDLGKGTMKKFQDEMPDRFFMEGISEANIVGMATGLALEGKIPYINTMSTFLMRRACEQVILDMCLHQVPVRLIGNGGGFVYAPLGPTHMAIDDLSIARAIPHLASIAPADAEEMKRAMAATLDHPGPVYIRVAKGGDPVVSREENPFKIGKPIPMREGSDALIVTTGITLKLGLEAADALSTEGFSVGVLHAHTLKPLAAADVLAAAAGKRAVVSIEEHTVYGGLGSAVAEILAEAGLPKMPGFKRIGIPDVFPDEYGSQASLMKKYAITAENLIATTRGLLLRRSS